jgi:general secretion pathway protein L
MLIIALPLHPELPEQQTKQPGQTFHYWLSPNAQTITLSGQASASGLPRNAGEVVAVIPWQAVSWHTVKCPPVPKAKLHSALMSLLEDQLLDEMSDLHLILPSDFHPTHASRQLTANLPGQPSATGKVHLSNEITLAACSKTWLRAAMNALTTQSNSNFRVQRIVCELAPATEVVPSSQTLDTGASPATDTPLKPAPELHIFGPATSSPHVVLCASHGVQKLPPNSSSWGAFPELGDARLRVFAEPQWVQSTLDTTGREPTLQTTAQRMLKAARAPWDAATGEWAQSSVLQILRWLQSSYVSLIHAEHWSLARKALVGTLVVNLIGLNALAWVEHSSLKKRESELIKQLKQTFPDLSYIVEPSLQMQGELKKIKHSKGQSAPGDLEAMLSAVALALAPDYKLKSFDYSKDELRLSNVTLEMMTEAGKKSLEKSGYSLRVDKTVYSGQTVPVLIITYK